MAKYITEVGEFRAVGGKPFLGESKEKGTPYIGVPVYVDDPDSEQHGAEGTYNAWLSDAAFDRSVKDLSEIFGWDGSLQDIADGKITFEGLPCSIVTEAETHNGKVYHKIKYLNSVDRQRQRGVMEGQKVADLIARMNSRAKAIAKQTGGTTPVSRAQPQAKNNAPF